MTTTFLECEQSILRASDAYAYMMRTVDHDIANRMIYELQPTAGWYPLGTIGVDSVLEDATDPEFGFWREFPQGKELAEQAAEYVAHHWDDGDNGAVDWALQKFEEFAGEDGIVLVPRTDASRNDHP